MALELHPDAQVHAVDGVSVLDTEDGDGDGVKPLNNFATPCPGLARIKVFN